MKIRVTCSAEIECEVDDKFQTLAEGISPTLKEELADTLLATLPNSTVKLGLNGIEYAETTDGILMCEW